ncbi:MAG: aminopeptidase P family protein [Undibacterium sp.]|nr:aminopeptidase P family protein [Opitutaceae bacterium]
MPDAPLPPPLLYADTERSADALYFGRVSVPDPFVALAAHGKKYAVVSALEFGRVKRDSAFDRVLPLEAYLAKARETWPQRKPGAAEVIFLLARELRQLSFTVPEDFPAGVYEKLFELGLDLTVASGPIFPEREIKTPAEIAALRGGNRCSALGIAAAERVLRDSAIRGRSLIYRGKPLTSERLKFAIESACLAAGAVSANTIAAGGDQACDPHGRGTGPLRPNQLIIVDVFPRVSATGYHGDMTRTFLRGTASDAQRALVNAVRAAQLAALKTIRAGVTGRAVHEAVVAIFTALGYKTKHTPKGSTGFFHGTGHGLGLAVHEAPGLSTRFDTPLRRGHVVTVEPGLYYPGLGACRIEDVVQVTATGHTLLSKSPYTWEL